MNSETFDSTWKKPIYPKIEIQDNFVSDSSGTIKEHLMCFTYLRKNFNGVWYAEKHIHSFQSSPEITKEERMMFMERLMHQIYISQTFSVLSDMWVKDVNQQSEVERLQKELPNIAKNLIHGTGK